MIRGVGGFLIVVQFSVLGMGYTGMEMGRFFGDSFCNPVSQILVLSTECCNCKIQYQINKIRCCGFILYISRSSVPTNWSELKELAQLSCSFSDFARCNPLPCFRRNTLYQQISPAAYEVFELVRMTV